MEYKNLELNKNYSNFPIQSSFVQHYKLKDVEDLLEIDYEPMY